MRISTMWSRHAVLAILAAGMCGSIALGQRIVNVPQGVGTLNEEINKDTTATGARVDTNTVYVLQRGGLYLTNAAIEKTFPVHIEAAAGSGLRPVIQPAVLTGGVSNRPFRPRANLTLKGVYVTNRDELGGLLTNIIRVTADNARIVIEDCHLDQDGQSAIRTDNDGISIFMKNSIVSNLGAMGSPDNGRGIDDRGNNLDSVVVENCTFYNVTSRVYRDGGGVTNYLWWNHNTMVNIGQHIGSFGPVTDFTFSNNLIVNGAFLGLDSTSTSGRRGIGFDSTGSQTAVIKNNNFFTNYSVRAARPDTVYQIPNFNDWAVAIVAASPYAASITEDSVGFANGPDAPVAVIQNYSYTSLTGTTEMDTTGGPFDFSYSNSLSVYSASEMGQPLGDLTWFGIDLIPTSVDQGVDLPKDFQVLGNYPNPFNPETSIRYTLGRQASVEITVFNVLGQEVSNLVNEMQTAGTHSVRWNGTTHSGEKAPSGVYLYRVSADGVPFIGKMTLLK